ncbi:MAG: M23 family metallopeptidase, partial [Anaerolineales bacterium]|nr:M23 family metallopeptidase [Anaerolineales bacterium]
MPTVIGTYSTNPAQSMFVILGAVGVLLLFLIWGAASRGWEIANNQPSVLSPQSSVLSPQPTVLSPQSSAHSPQFSTPGSQQLSTSIDASSIVAPYANYVLTQGPHGSSYGHMAIDLTAGNGATILSPIDGVVTGYHVDEYKNTVLVIENEVYQITLMHGNYAVAVGDDVRQGQSVGTESNNGYTMDMNGNLCYERDCGYHTHLNV